MKGLRPSNLRARLTLWYLTVFGGILVLYVACTSTLVYFGLREFLDEDLVEDIERTESLIQFTPDGAVRLAAVGDKADPDKREDVFIEILSRDGRVLYRNGELGNSQLGAAPVSGEGVGGYSQRSSRLPDGTPIRVASRLHEAGSRPVLIRIARSEEPLRRQFREVLFVLILGLPIALALAGLAGYGFARRILAPLGAMARRAEQITAERLHERLPVENPQDELGHLARVFNETLTRLEVSFEQLRRFTADASHELRTPLTAIRSVGEVGLHSGGSIADYREVIGSMLEETNRLTRMVESLLTLSRADAGTVQLQRVRLSMLAVAREAAGLLEVLAEEKRQKLTVEGESSLMVNGDRVFLRQAVLNLIDNAIKYSPAGGKIAVRVIREGDRVVFEVADEGPGVPPEHRGQVFNRFYRVDKARSREAGGAGLGLAITRWAVEAHGGTIAVDSSNEERGATFRVVLPLADPEKFAAAS
jgi:heavy metal sensor kinase